MNKISSSLSSNPTSSSIQTDTELFGMKDLAETLNLGLIIVDKNGKILLWNRWISRHSAIPETNALNRQLEHVFSEPVSPAFLNALKNTQTYRLPVVLSTALHRTPLPLYSASEKQQQGTRMYQSITISPLQSKLGDPCCLIQVADSSPSIKRENILRSHSELLKKEATTDGLTDINNRRFFDAHYEMAVADAKRQQYPLSVFMIDIDYFKAFNDHYGHPAGDKVIKLVASALKSKLSRATDFLARYGGEEFVLVMPHLSEDFSAQFAEKLQKAVLDLAIPHEKSEQYKQITVSIGVCTGIPDKGQNLLNIADAALYQAKRKGRNRFVSLSPELEQYLQQ